MTTMPPMLTGPKLKAIRAMRGVSQDALAKMAGVSVMSIAKFEQGKTDMRSSTIIKLCEALDVTVTYHIGDTDMTGP